MNAHASGLEVTEHRNVDSIIKGNADVARSERGTPRPDTRHCTLPIYPLQHDLPQLRRAGGAV